MNEIELIHKFLSGAASEAEEKQVKDWILASDDNLLEFQSIKLLYENTIDDEDDPNYNAEGTWIKIKGVIKAEKRTKRLIRTAIIAAITVALIALAYFLSLRVATSQTTPSTTYRDTFAIPYSILRA